MVVEVAARPLRAARVGIIQQWRPHRKHIPNSSHRHCVVSRIVVVACLLTVAGCSGVFPGASDGPPTTIVGCSYDESLPGVGSDDEPRIPEPSSSLNESSVEGFVTELERAVAYHTYHEPNWETWVSLRDTTVTRTADAFVVTIGRVIVAGRGPNGSLDSSWAVRYHLTDGQLIRTIGPSRAPTTDDDGERIAACTPATA